MGNSHTIVKLKEGKLWYIDESKIENLPSTERLQLPMGLKGYFTEKDFLNDTKSLANNSNNVKIYSLSDRNDRTTVTVHRSSCKKNPDVVSCLLLSSGFSWLLAVE